MTGGIAGPLEGWDDRGHHLAPLPKRDIHFCKREELGPFLSCVKSPVAVLAELFLEGHLELKSGIYDNAK